MRGRGINKFVLFLICALIFGCQEKVDPEALLGSYTVKYPYGIEQLVIMPGGVYEQFFSLNGQTLMLINNGKWEIRRLDGEQLVLYDPVIVDDGFGKISEMKKKSGIWPLHVRKGLSGNISFPINEDLGLEFHRIK